MNLLVACIQNQIKIQGISLLEIHLNIPPTSRSLTNRGCIITFQPATLAKRSYDDEALARRFYTKLRSSAWKTS